VAVLIAGDRRQWYAIANEIVDGLDRIWNCKTWQVGIEIRGT